MSVPIAKAAAFAIVSTGDPAGALSFTLEEGVSTWTWDVAGGGVTWSRGIDALFGLPEGGFGGTYEAYVALVHPDDRAHFQALIARTLEGEDEYVMSHRVVWPDGSIHWIHGRGRLTRSTDGRPLVLSGVSWDAAARKRAEARLLHLHRVQAVAGAVTKELLRVRSERAVFECACRIAVEHGHFRFAWIGLLQKAATEVVPAARAGIDEGYLDEITVTVDLSARGRGPVGSSIREGRPIVVNDIERDEAFVPWRTPALRRGYRGCASFPLRQGGKVIGALAIYAAEDNRFDALQLDLFIALSEDIGFTLDAIEADARRRAAEEAMTRSEESFRALFEQASDAIFVAEGDYRIVDVNPAGCQLTGYSQTELRSMLLTDVLDPTERRPLSSRVEERLLRCKDGGKVDAEISATVLTDGRVQAYVRDVSSRKRVQQQLILADRLASLGRLAAGVAHEVNNPLSYLTLNLGILEQGLDGSPELLGESLRAAAREARDGAERVRTVVRALGAFGRDDEAPIGFLDVHRVLDTAARLVENMLRHRGRIVKQYAAKQGVRGNELRLAQVFVNLLVNAADALDDAASETNQIRVRTFDEGTSVVVEVQDNGVGIAPEIIGRIFDPFFTTKAVGERTGLGLAISHSIVRSFGGTLGVESIVGKGSTFRVRLDAADEQLKDVAQTATLEKAAPPSARRARVLIIDDEPRLAAVIATSLEHHDVTIAGSGRAGLERCVTGDFDCILCDLMMPQMSGMDLHAELARTGTRIEERIVFMTGGAFTTRAREFVKSVPNVVLEKPFTAERLESVIRSVLDARGE